MFSNINYKALAWTTGIHLLLLLLFLLFKLSSPVNATPVQEMGIEVNLGTDEDGSGTDQPMDTEAPAPETHTAAVQPTATVSSSEKEMMTSDKEETAIRRNPNPAPRQSLPNNKPVITSSKETKPNAATTRPNTSAVAQPKYAYPGATGRGGNSATTNRAGTGEGDGTGSGDKGVPGGTPGAKNYTGTPGTGTMGINHSIADRRIVAFPEREAEFNNGGKVVLRITVNREGKIVAKLVKSSPSATLTQIALRKADQLRFDKNMDAPVEQFGTITFVFKARG